jgi:hypothetical protein
MTTTETPVEQAAATSSPSISESDRKELKDLIYDFTRINLDEAAIESAINDLDALMDWASDHDFNTSEAEDLKQKLEELRDSTGELQGRIDNLALSDFDDSERPADDEKSEDKSDEDEAGEGAESESDEAA